MIKILTMQNKKVWTVGVVQDDMEAAFRLYDFCPASRERLLAFWSVGKRPSTNSKKPSGIDLILREMKISEITLALAVISNGVGEITNVDQLKKAFEYIGIPPPNEDGLKDMMDLADPQQTGKVTQSQLVSLLVKTEQDE